MRYPLIAVLLLAAGCVSDQTMRLALARDSAPEIGCPADEIEVTNKQGPNLDVSPVTTWTATCRGKVFLCKGQLLQSGGPGGSNYVKSCKPSPMQ